MTETPIRPPSADPPISIAPSGGRILVRAGDVVIADTRRALTLREARHPPVQYIPREDVDMARLVRSAHRTRCPHKGEASYFSVPILGGKAADAVWTYEQPIAAVQAIAGFLAFYADRFTIASE